MKDKFKNRKKNIENMIIFCWFILTVSTSFCSLRLLLENNNENKTYGD